MSLILDLLSEFPDEIRSNGVPVAASLTTTAILLAILAWNTSPTTLWIAPFISLAGGIIIGWLTPRTLPDQTGTNALFLILLLWGWIAFQRINLFPATTGVSGWVFNILGYGIILGFSLLMGCAIGRMIHPPGFVEEDETQDFLDVEPKADNLPGLAEAKNSSDPLMAIIQARQAAAALQAKTSVEPLPEQPPEISSENVPHVFIPPQEVRPVTPIMNMQSPPIPAEPNPEPLAFRTEKPVVDSPPKSRPPAPPRAPVILDPEIKGSWQNAWQSPDSEL